MLELCEAQAPVPALKPVTINNALPNTLACRLLGSAFLTPTVFDFTREGDEPSCRADFQPRSKASLLGQADMRSENNPQLPCSHPAVAIGSGRPLAGRAGA